MTMYFYIGFHLMLTMASVSLHEFGNSNEQPGAVALEWMRTAWSTWNLYMVVVYMFLLLFIFKWFLLINLDDLGDCTLRSLKSYLYHSKFYFLLARGIIFGQSTCCGMGRYEAGYPGYHHVCGVDLGSRFLHVPLAVLMGGELFSSWF